MDEEYADVLEKAQMAAKITNPWTLLLFHKKYRYVVPHCCYWLLQWKVHTKVCLGTVCYHDTNKCAWL